MVKRNNTARLARRAALAQKNASKRQRDELARRKRMGVGLIERPLRFVVKRNGSEKNIAIAMAQMGYGSVVRAVAFNELRDRGTT